MAENLKAFEDLKETTANSLDAKEKADLNKISPEDIRSEKDKVGDKMFVVDGQSMKLKDIAKNLKFDVAWTTATLNWKKIARWSELWAALQVYAIAYNKSIGRFLIDWKLWTNSVAWLQGAQTEAKVGTAPRQPEKPEDSDEVKEQNVGRLLNAIYTDYVGRYNDPKYNLLNTKSGADNGTLKNKKLDGDKVTITYRSAVWNKENQTIVVDASKCKTWKQYSVDKFWKAIEDAIKAKENALQKAENDRKAKEKLEAENKLITDWINKFNESSLSNKVVKKYLVDNKFNFSVKSINNGNVSFEDGKWWNFVKSRSELLDWTNKFNSSRFESIVTSNYLGKATNYVKGTINTSKDAIKNMPMSNMNQADSYIRKCDELITKIDSYWAGDAFKVERNAVVAMRSSAEATKRRYETNKENQDAYKAKSGEMNKDLDTMKSKANKRLSRMEVRQARTDCINLAMKYVNLSKISDNTYKMAEKSDVASVFSKVGKRSEYVSAMNQIKDYLDAFDVRLQS